LKIPVTALPFLNGEKFSNAFQLRFSRRKRKTPTRMDFITQRVQNSRVIHMGCVDHLPLIPQKIERNQWLHKKIVEAASRCLGVDIDKEGVCYVKDELGYRDVMVHDILNDVVPENIRNERWDFMVLGELLEHIDDPVTFLKALKSRYAAYIDKIIISVPHAFQIDNFKFNLLGKEVINSDHRYWFTAYTLSKILVLSGYRNIQIDFFEGFKTPLGRPFKRLLLSFFPQFSDTLVAVDEFGE